METKNYNGWTNYETWLVKLWIDNDEGSYNYWRNVAQECYEQAEDDIPFTRKECAVLALSERLKDEHEENAPTGTTGVYADLMNGALSEVDWHEIALSMIDDDVEKEEEDDEKRSAG